MADALAIYGAVAGSAGLLSLAWQLLIRREERKTRLVFEAFHVDQTVWPDDARYEFAKRDPGDESGHRYEPGTAVTGINLSRHSVWIKGGGITQFGTEASPTAEMYVQPIELQPLRSFNEIWVPDWYSVD